MARTILSVGIQIPGGDIENVDVLSRRSLLDADIIVFAPKVPYSYAPENFEGKPSLSDDASFHAREALVHWRRELLEALNAEKVILVLLRPPEQVFAATGKKEYSGTGRNVRTMRMVGALRAYDALPLEFESHASSGNNMTVEPKARYFAAYWSEFEEYSHYEVYFKWENSEILIRTKTGNRVVGACIRKGKGALLLVPDMNLDLDEFTETRKVKNEEKEYWTKAAKSFGHKFSTGLIALAEPLAAEVSVTPPPSWTQDDAYRLSDETYIENKINDFTTQITQLEAKRRIWEVELQKAGELRSLLFEQGKPLENAVLSALKIIGFSAEGFKDGESEFDAVFSSGEGRFIGEVEGKDNKAINIDKFSQLERNLSEDFARKEVNEHAKGVLFGNAFRLKPIKERQASFTDKCVTASMRVRVALIHTPDLFKPARYLKIKKDADYAKKCRTAIFESVGIVKFPDPPDLDQTAQTTNRTAQDAATD